MRSVAARAFQKITKSSASNHTLKLRPVSLLLSPSSSLLQSSSFSTQSVTVDTYSHSTTTRRLPNNDRERNALYNEEESRTMANITSSVRHDWTKEEIASIYNLPFHELMYKASTTHRMYWNPSEVQQCTLLSIKT